MLDRPQGNERAILVQLTLPEMEANTALAEFHELALSAGAEVLACIQGSRSKPDAKYFVGLGKANEIKEQVEALHAELVLVNHELSPSQERNLERLFQCRVVGRSGLILDIFAQRAQTFEGKLQVELAQLQHLSTRLIRGWTHLERQKGGIGLRGPGETQLETDRRLLRDRIKQINKRLDKVRLSRDQNRRARQKASLPTVSLVGYTNAGKSSLFNALTGAAIYTADQLFATLDPTLRKLELDGAPSVVLSDTVGFIQDLPHTLIKAFHATLEETCLADLLLHVIDISDPNWSQNEAIVEQVLADIGAESTPIIRVLNKIDIKGDLKPMVSRNPLTKTNQVWVSAKTGEGLALLKETIVTLLYGEVVEESISLSMNDAKLRAKLYEVGAVINEEVADDGSFHLTIRLSPQEKRILFSHKEDIT